MVGVRLRFDSQFGGVEIHSVRPWESKFATVVGVRLRFGSWFAGIEVHNVGSWEWSLQLQSYGFMSSFVEFGSGSVSFKVGSVVPHVGLGGSGWFGRGLGSRVSWFQWWNLSGGRSWVAVHIVVFVSSVAHGY